MSVVEENKTFTSLAEIRRDLLPDDEEGSTDGELEAANTRWPSGVDLAETVLGDLRQAVAGRRGRRRRRPSA